MAQHDPQELDKIFTLDLPLSAENLDKVIAHMRDQRATYLAKPPPKPRNKGGAKAPSKKQMLIADLNLNMDDLLNFDAPQDDISKDLLNFRL